MTQSTRIDQETLRQLHVLVDRMGQAEDSWDWREFLPLDAQLTHFANRCPSAQSSQAAKSALATLASLKVAACSMVKRLEEAEHHLIVEIHTNGVLGLYSLPDEIISAILGYIIDSDEIPVSTQTVELTHVSRRFRRILLDTPRHWTILPDMYPMEVTDACLARSQEAGLTVRMCGDTISQSFVEKTLAHVSRWTSLEFWSVATYQGFCKEYPVLDLPQLKSLDVGRALVSFIPQLWSTPKLGHFHTICSIEEPLRTSITHYETHALTSEDAVELKRLFRYLSDSPMLSSLDLKFGADPNTAFQSPAVAVQLPTVGSFHLCIDEYPHLVGWIDIFSVRSLTELVLSFDGEGRVRSLAEFVEVCTTFCKDWKEMPKLRVFSLEFFVDVIKLQASEELHPGIDLLDHILPKLPTLEVLIVKSEFIKPPAYDLIIQDKQGKNLLPKNPALRTLSMGHNRLVDYRYLEGLAKAVQGLLSWPNFREIMASRYLGWQAEDGQKLQDLLGSKALFWQEGWYDDDDSTV